MKAFLALAALGLALVTSGCTSSGQPAAAPPASESTDSNSDGGLGLKLLTETDLPAGYSEVQLPVKGGMGALVGCPALDTPASAGTGEASVSFAGGTAGSLIHQSIRLVTAAEGSKMLADLAALPSQCGNAKTASLSAMGEQSTALQLTATPPQLGVAVDSYLMAVRDATTVVVIVFANPGKADPAAAEAVTKTAWEKASPK